MATAHHSTSTASPTPARPPQPASRRWALALWVAAALVGASLCASAAAQDQQYAADPVDARAKANSGICALCVRNPGTYAAQKEPFADYFAKYYFPAMTLHGEDDLEQLGDLRLNLFRRYLWASTDEQLQQDLTRLTYQAMRHIINPRVDPPYHPAVRYNAMLVLGMLDAQYAIDAGSNRRPPKPLPEANDLLVAAANAGIEGKIPPALLVGALVGLERHSQYHESLTPQATDAMASVVLKIIDRDEPIEDVDRNVYVWMQLRAASVLANLGTVGADNRNHNGLLKLIAGSKSLDDRCQLARLLRKINYQGATIDGKATTDELMKLALDVSQAEAKRAKDFQDTYVPGGWGDRGGGRGFGETKTYDRRCLLARLVNLRGGLQAIEPITPDTAKPKLATIVSAIGAVIDAAEDTDTIDLDLVTKVQEMAKVVQGAVSTDAAPAAGAAPEAPS